MRCSPPEQRGVRPAPLIHMPLEPHGSCAERGGAGCPFCAQTSPNDLTSLLTNLHRIGTPRRWACVTVAESLRPARVGTWNTVRVSALRRTPAEPWVAFSRRADTRSLV
jgi:hypothetical protein